MLKTFIGHQGNNAPYNSMIVDQTLRDIKIINKQGGKSYLEAVFMCVELIPPVGKSLQ